MAQYLTLARPYAKAVFADAEKTDLCDQWQQALQILTACVTDLTLRQYLESPKVTHQQVQALLMDICRSVSAAVVEKLGDSLVNFLALIIFEKRLLILPDIEMVYQRLLAAKQQILEAEVSSAYPLDKQQKESLLQALEKRFNSKMTLEFQENKSLIGGIVVRTEKWVLDGSVRGKLEKMQQSLSD